VIEVNKMRMRTTYTGEQPDRRTVFAKEYRKI
jgi:hypothetical protein